MTSPKSQLIVLALSSFVIGFAYIISGFVAVVNWLGIKLVSDSGVISSIISHVPGDPWLCVVLVTIGLIMSSTTYYLMRNNLVVATATLLVGSGLGVSVAFIQVLASIATVLATLIAGAGVDSVVLMDDILRIDAVLGYISLPLFLASSKVFRDLRRRRNVLAIP